MDRRFQFALWLITAAALAARGQTPATAPAPAPESEITARLGPISLEIKNATFPQTIKALADSTDARISVGDYREDPAEPCLYTLSAKNRPFWEVFGDLSRQHGIGLNGGFPLANNDPGEWRRLVTAGPAGCVAAFPGMIIYSKGVDVQQPAGHERSAPEMTFYYRVAVDPRLDLVSATPPQLTKVVDDQGNILLAKPLSAVRESIGGLPGIIWRQTSPLTAPAKMGTKIASATGELRFSVETGSSELTVTDLPGKLHQPLQIGAQVVSISHLEITDDRVVISFTAHDGPVTVTVIDADGNAFAPTYVMSNEVLAEWKTAYKPPLKLELKVPIASKEIVIPFEMKDLPLPRQ